MTLSNQPKAVMLCIESEFDTSRPAFCWALQNLVGEEDTVHVVTAVAPAPCSLQGALSCGRQALDQPLLFAIPPPMLQYCSYCSYSRLPSWLEWGRARIFSASYVCIHT